MEADFEQTEKIECGLIFRSIGYFGVPVEEGIPYDHQKGIVPNIDGFVEPGLYCAGWLATGPRGVIGGFQLLDLIIMELKSHMTC